MIRQWFTIVLLVTLTACGSGAATAVSQVGEPSAAPTVVLSPTATSSPPATATTPAPTATAAPPTATTAPPTATTAPSPTRPAASPTTRPRATATTTAARSTGPSGTVPAGWKVYRGSAQVPFTIAYPPNWTVDESKASSNQISFNAPGNAAIVQIGSTGKSARGANLDVERDAFFRSVSSFCTKTGIDQTGDEERSGIKFATLGATCDTSGGLAYIFTGLGLNGTNQVPWFYNLIALYGNYQTANTTYFQPMLGTLNVYGNP